MLLLAHPLQSYGTAGHRPGGEGCIGGDIVGAIVAVAARALGVNAAYLAWRQAQQLGQGLAQRVDALAVRPYRHAAILPERHGAGWPDRAVHQARPAVARLDHLAVRRRRRPGIVEDRHLLRRQATDRLAHVFCRQLGARPVPAGRLQALQCLDGLPLLRRQHGGEPAVTHHLHDPWHLGDGVDVGGLEPRAFAGTARDAGMEHAGQPHVLHIGNAARDLGRNIDAGQVRADQTHALLAPRHVRFGLDMERQQRGQFAVAQAVAVRRMGRAIVQLDLLDGDQPAPRRCLGQQDAHVGGGIEDGRAAVLHRMAARGDALVGRACGIGGYKLDAGWRHRKLVRRNLDQRRLQSLAEFRLAREHRDMSVGVDADPRIEQGEFVEVAGQGGSVSMTWPIARCDREKTTTSAPWPSSRRRVRALTAHPPRRCARRRPWRWPRAAPRAGCACGCRIGRDWAPYGRAARPRSAGCCVPAAPVRA